MIYKFVALASLLASTFANIVPITRYGPLHETIKDDYIVRFFPDAVKEFHTAVHQRKKFTNPIHVNDFGSYHGFHGIFSDEELSQIQQMEGVMSIEPNGKVYALQQNPQLNPTSWGLDRVDQRDLPLNQQYGWDNDGSNANVFVLDTGILTTHNDFNGRAHFGADCTNDATGCQTTSDTADQNGHGTHCAGTIGATTMGVAKNTNIYNVRCLNALGSGSFAGIINAVQHVVEWNDRPGAKIISMSLGGGFNAALNNAVDAAFDAGVLSVIAAGNSNNNACTLSPASAEHAFTIAASDISDRKASFSSFGTCVDLWAPGVNINSTANTGGYSVLSGTSMACPHVAGAAAVVASRENLVDPQSIADILVAASTADKIIGNPFGTPNQLLYTLSA